MKRLIVATQNSGKVVEIKSIVASLGFEVLCLGDLDNVPEIIENENSFAGNARIKAATICEAFDSPALADDSGLSVDAMDGRPGVLSARYGGKGLDDSQRYEKLLEELRDLPDGNRTAAFHCAMVYMQKNTTSKTFEGIIKGRIAHKPAGTGGFGYDPVFIPDGFENQTMAQLSLETKKSISHRAQALAAFSKWIKEIDN